MKRFLSFFSAMFIFIASFYVFIIPAYADEIVPYEGTTSVSIWDEAFDEYFDALTHFYSDFTDDWKLNDLTVTGFQRKSVEYMVTKAGIASDSFTFDAIVDYICANPADFDISYQFDWLAGYGNIVPGANTIDAIQQYVYDNYYSIPSPDRITTDTGGLWIKTPFSYSSYRIVGSTTSNGSTNTADVYVSILRNSGAVVASYYTTSDNAVYCNFAFINPSTGAVGSVSGGPLSNTFTYNGSVYRVSNSTSDFFRSVFSGFAGYSNYTAAFNDFYGYVPSGEPVSNGDVYVGNEIDISADLPSIINNDFSQLSEYYYNTYGDTYPDADIDNNYYYNYYNYVIDYSGDFSVPYWLINGTDPVYTFSDPVSDYDLSTIELADNELPSSYNMGWYQDIWDSLPSDVIALFGIILSSTIGVGLLKS